LQGTTGRPSIVPIPKRIEVLTPEIRAYIAGLIDGEDTLTLPG